MANEKKEQGDLAISAAPEKQSIQTADALDARNAAASDVKAVLAQNQNAHSGSAGGDQLESIQIIALDERGKQKVVAERPKETKQEPAITTDFLRERAKQPDIWAQKFVDQIEKAEKLPAPYRDGHLAQILKEAEAVYRPKDATQKAENDPNLMDTGTMLAVEAQTNPAAEPVKLLKEWVEKQPESPQKQAFRQEVRQQAADLSPEMQARMKHLEIIRRRIDVAGLEEGGVHQAITPDMASRTKLEGQVTHDQPLENTADGWLEAGRRISELPVDKQLTVIGSGLLAGYEQYQHDERERTWGQILGTTEGLGAVAVNLATIAEFTCDCIAGNKERAAERGELFGNAIGETIVSGIKLFQDADAYLFKVGFDGDYGRPFKDLVHLGMALNDRWSQLPPREQERLKYKLITEMAADGLIGAGGAKAIGKAKVFTEVLDAIALEAKTTTRATIEGSKRAARAISNAVDNLTQPVVEIPGVGKVKYQRDLGKPADKPLTHVLMSQADDLGRAARPGRLLVNGKDGSLIKFEKLKHLEISETVGDASNSHWTGANFLTGWKVEGSLKDKFMAAGEALPNSFPAIDGWSVEKGLVTSIKSIELRAPTYQDMEKFEERVGGYLQELEAYEGAEQAIQGIKIEPERIKGKVLHLGVPDAAMTLEQKAILEKLARELESKGSDTKIKVTALR